MTEKLDLKKRHHRGADYLEHGRDSSLFQGNGLFGVQLLSRAGLSNPC